MKSQQVVDLLNSAYRADPAAINMLFSLRRPCNRDLADHPHVQVATSGETGDEKFSVGLIGIICGMLGSVGQQLVAMQTDDQNNVLGFQLYTGGEQE